ncbi:MAG: 1,4-dihydroxy-2-naphthoate polyprenyltransferase [Candidatus Omnitrophica bacterium]|nr:1,4-dihydroxy-2-naphthoate polyprenyltransferase [Candidatus Omnitrophota bacterium]
MNKYMQPSFLKIWLTAIRPKTLPAAIAPVIMGTGMAFGDGVHHLSSAVVALLGALTIQIGTNLANDYFDFQKGADNENRQGPTRVTQAGWVTPNQMIVAVTIFFLLSALACGWLVLRAGWPIAIIGILSIAFGLLYTAGPFSLAYLGLGETFALLFFGPIAVAGTYYVQSFEINEAVILAGFGPGFLSAAILAINNLRDIETDRGSRKKTLAVRLGKRFAQNECFIFVIAAALIPVLIYGMIQDHIEILWTALIALFAFPTIQAVYSQSEGPELNGALAHTGRLLFIYSLVFSMGWISYEDCWRQIISLRSSF